MLFNDKTLNTHFIFILEMTMDSLQQIFRLVGMFICTLLKMNTSLSLICLLVTVTLRRRDINEFLMSYFTYCDNKGG